jgi:hypothetical protein
MALQVENQLRDERHRDRPPVSNVVSTQQTNICPRQMDRQDRTETGFGMETETGVLIPPNEGVHACQYSWQGIIVKVENSAPVSFIELCPFQAILPSFR